jgi:hypothetical protein
MIHIQGPRQDRTSGGSRRARQDLIQAQRSNFCVGLTHQFAFISSSATLQKKRAERMKSLFSEGPFFARLLRSKSKQTDGDKASSVFTSQVVSYLGDSMLCEKTSEGS